MLPIVLSSLLFLATADLPSPAEEPCLVPLDGQRTLAESLERCAIDAAVRHVQAPDRFEALSYRFGGAGTVRGSILRVTTVSTEGPNQSGVIQLRLRLEGDSIAEARASVRGTVHGPALVPLRTLSRNLPIDPDSVTTRVVDWTRLGEPPLRSIDDLDGMVPVRTLSAGRAVTPSLLAPEPLVRKGDLVELEVRRSGFVVSARGLAITDGIRGETILVENTANGARLMARVEDHGRLEVVRGPSGRNR